MFPARMVFCKTAVPEFTAALGLGSSIVGDSRVVDEQSANIYNTATVYRAIAANSTVVYGQRISMAV